MKKVFLVIALVLTCYFCYADGFGTDSGVILTYQTINSTGSPAVTVVPTTSIYPGRDKILGYEVVGNFNGGNSERWVSVYDDSSAALSGENLGESEALEGSFACKWFPYPRDIEIGVAVMQGANTVVTIYFERG